MKRRYLLKAIAAAFIAGALAVGAYWLGHNTATAANSSTEATTQLANVQSTLSAVNADLAAHTRELQRLKNEQAATAQATLVLDHILTEAGQESTYIQTELANLCNATHGCIVATPPVLAPLPTPTTTTTTTTTTQPRRSVPPTSPRTTTTTHPRPISTTTTTRCLFPLPIVGGILCHHPAGHRPTSAAQAPAGACNHPLRGEGRYCASDATHTRSGP